MKNLKKYIVLLVLSGFLSSSYCQNNVEIFAGIYYAPLINNYKFNPILDHFGNELKHEYLNKYNYATGLNLYLLTKNNLYIDLNIAYSSKGYILDYNFTTQDANDPLILDKAIIEAGYLDLKSGFGYNFSINENINIIPFLHIGYGLLINNKKVSITNDDTKYVHHGEEGTIIAQNLNKDLWIIGADIKFEFCIKEKLKFYLNPGYISLLANISDNIVGDKLGYIKLETGITYKITQK